MIITKAQSVLLLRLIDEIHYQLGVRVGYSSVWGSFVDKEDEFIVCEEGHLFEAGDYLDAKIKAIHLIHVLDFQREHQGILVQEQPVEFPQHEEKCKEFMARILRSMENGDLTTNPSAEHEDEKRKISVTRLGNGGFSVSIKIPGVSTCLFGIPVGKKVKEQASNCSSDELAIIYELVGELMVKY